MRRLIGIVAVLTILSGLGVFDGARAQAPATITYQGRLTDPSGAPIAAASSVVFSIYAGSSGGSALWTETIAVDPDAEGIFATVLGATTPLNATVFSGAERFLGIKVGTDAEMTPRQRINAVPYAISAGAAPTGGGGTVTSVATGAGLTGGPITTTGTISVANGAVTSTMITDGTIANADIAAAAAIAATKIAGDAGVEFASLGSSTNIPTTARNLGSIAMSIPATGYVVLLATCSATVFGDNTEIVFGLGTTSGGFELHQAQSGFLDGSATTRREYSMTSMAVVSVTAGTSTFYCNTVKTSVFSANQVNLGEIQLIGVFIPKRY